MKKNVNVILVLCLLVCPILFSCGNGNSDPTCNYATELEVELNALLAASQAYSLDPTVEKCEAYKSSVQAYLDEAVEFENCAFTAGQGAEYQAAIDQQQAALDALICQ